MQVIYEHNDIPISALNAVTLIGNFDGVHLGHQSLIKKAKKIAKKYHKPLNVLTFEPHPKTFFENSDNSFRITPIQNKITALKDLNVDNLIIINFNADVSSLSPDEFVKKYLVDYLKVYHIVVGKDFNFGKDAKGNAKTLKQLGSQYGFGVTLVKNIANRNMERYSSTSIRNYIVNSNIPEANEMLGRKWEVEDVVQKGAQIGRSIGFPTANIKMHNYLKPRTGVYAVKAGVKDIQNKDKYVWYNAIANFGTRPTVNGKSLLLEVHLLNFDRDIYGENIRIKFLDFLRPEIKFKDLNTLKKTIAEDIWWAQLVFDREKNKNRK